MKEKETKEKDVKIKNKDESKKENNKKLSIPLLALIIIALIAIILIIMYIISICNPKKEMKPAPDVEIDYNLLNTEVNNGNITMQSETNAELKDGVKRNIAPKIKQEKSYNDLIIKDAIIEASGGMSQFIAKVQNPYDKSIEENEVEVIFLDENGNEITKLESVIPTLEAKGESEMNLATEIDITNANDYTIKSK